MNLFIVLLVIGIIVFGAVIIVGISVSSWARVMSARHSSTGPISQELASELKAELVEIKENLASINKMLREVQ